MVSVAWASPGSGMTDIGPLPPTAGNPEGEGAQCARELKADFVPSCLSVPGGNMEKA